MDCDKSKLAEQFDKFPWVGSYADCVALGQTGELAAIDDELRRWLSDMASMGQAIMDADEQLAMVYQLVHRAHLRARVALESVRVGLPVRIADCAYRNAVHVAEVTLAYVYDFRSCVESGYVQEYLDDMRAALLEDDDDVESVGSPCMAATPGVHEQGFEEVPEVATKEALRLGQCVEPSVASSSEVEVDVEESLAELVLEELPVSVSHVAEREGGLAGVEHCSVEIAMLDGEATCPESVTTSVPALAIVPAVSLDDEASYPFAVLNSVTVIGDQVKLADAQIVLHHTGWGLRDSAEGMSDKAIKLMHAVTMVEAVNAVVSNRVWTRPMLEQDDDRTKPRYINVVAGTFGILRFDITCHQSSGFEVGGDKPSSVTAGAVNVFTGFPAHLNGAYRDRCGIRVVYVDPPRLTSDGWFGDGLSATHGVVCAVARRQDFDAALPFDLDGDWSGPMDCTYGFEDEDYADMLVAREAKPHAVGGHQAHGELVRLIDSTLLSRQLAGDDWRTYDAALQIVKVVQLNIASFNSYVWVGTPGYCYLEIVKPRYRRLVSGTLGAWPLVADLLALDSNYFDLDVVAGQAMMLHVRSGVFHLERVDLLPGVHANGRLLDVWSSRDLQAVQALDGRSLAGWLGRTRAAHAIEGIGVTEPAVSLVPLHARVGGSYAEFTDSQARLVQEMIDGSPYFASFLVLQLLWILHRWCFVTVDRYGCVVSFRREVGLYFVLVALQVYCWATAIGYDLEL